MATSCGFIRTVFLPISAVICWVVPSAMADAPVGERPSGAISFPESGAEGTWTVHRSFHPQFRQPAVYDEARNRFIVIGSGGDARWLDETPGRTAWRRLLPTESPLLGLSEGCAAIDAIGDRLLYFGGNRSGYPTRELWQLPLASPSAWQPLVATDTAPTLLEGSNMVYDPTRRCMLVLHQASSPSIYRLWLGGSPSWELVAASGDGPTWNYGIAFWMAWIGSIDALLVVGGIYGDESWILNLSGEPRWRKLSPNTRPTNYGWYGARLLEWDPQMNRVILLQESEPGSSFPHAYWYLDLASEDWVRVRTIGDTPLNRKGFSAALDSVRRRLLLYGGLDDYAIRNDTWSVGLEDGARWIEAEVQPASCSGWVYDSANSLFYLLGGLAGLTWRGYPLFDPRMWKFDPELLQWSVLAPRTDARMEPTLTFDPARKEIFAAGGYWLDVSFCHPSYPDYLPRYTNETWGFTTPDPQEFASLGSADPIHGHSTIYDAHNDRMILFGGETTVFDHCDHGTHTRTERTNRLLTFDREAREWITLAADGDPPPPMAFHLAVYDEDRQRMVIVGGFAGFVSYRSFVWFLSLRGEPRWTSIQVGGTLPGLASRDIYSPIISAVYDPVRERMVVIDPERYNDAAAVLELSMREPLNWRRLSPSGETMAMGGRSRAAYDERRDRIVAYGGDIWFLTWGDPLRRVRIEARLSAATAFDSEHESGLARITVFGEADFDVLSLNAATILVSGAPIEGRGTGIPLAQIRDVDADGWKDATYFVRATAMSPDVSEDGIRFDARTFDGHRIRGWTAGSAAGRDRVRLHSERRVDSSLKILATIPSPARGDRLEFHLSLPNISPATLTIFDVQGRIVSSADLHAPTHGAQQIVLRPSPSLLSGVYFVHLSQSNRTATNRFVVVE